MSNLTGVIGAAAQGLESILGGKKKVQFIQNNKTVLTLDASLNETHSRASPPTEFPVENGQTISDHVIVKPFSLEITGVISDTPIGGLSGLLTEAATSLVGRLLPPAGLIGAAGAVSLISALTGSSSPSAAAYVQLIQLQQNGMPFDVITSLFRYPSMWIADLSVPREAVSGNILLFTVKLVQLLLVTPQSVNVQIFANPALSANKADAGNQSSGIPNGFQQGVADTNAAIGQVSPKGIAGGAF